MDAPFDIKFVRMGSLILATTVKRCILQDNKVLRRAVKMFLKEILFFGEIDTTIKAVLKVEAYQLDKEKFCKIIVLFVGVLADKIMFTCCAKILIIDL